MSYMPKQNPKISIASSSGGGGRHPQEVRSEGRLNPKGSVAYHNKFPVLEPHGLKRGSSKVYVTSQDLHASRMKGGRSLSNSTRDSMELLDENEEAPGGRKLSKKLQRRISRMSGYHPGSHMRPSYDPGPEMNFIHSERDSDDRKSSNPFSVLFVLFRRNIKSVCLTLGLGNIVIVLLRLSAEAIWINAYLFKNQPDAYERLPLLVGGFAAVGLSSLLIIVSVFKSNQVCALMSAVFIGIGCVLVIVWSSMSLSSKPKRDNFLKALYISQIGVSALLFTNALLAILLFFYIRSHSHHYSHECACQTSDHFGHTHH